MIKPKNKPGIVITPDQLEAYLRRYVVNLKAIIRETVIRVNNRNRRR